MKNLKKWMAALLTGITIFSMMAMPVMAAENETALKPTDLRMAQLKLEERGVDLSKGELISEYWGREEDGTPYVERLYIVHDSLSARSPENINYKKTKDYGATGYVEVIGYFTYDTAAQTVHVRKVEGGLYDKAGISSTRNEQKYSKNEGTKIATAVYSIEVNRNLGGWTTYSVSVTCDYRGK